MNLYGKACGPKREKPERLAVSCMQYVGLFGKTILRFRFVENKVVVSNFISLSILQISKYIFPLVTFPYLVRVMGPERFGLIAFAQAFTQYFVLVTDYGFNLTATRQISINRSNGDKVSQIFCSVMIVRVLLMIVSFVIFAGLVLCVPKFRTEWAVYFITFIGVLGNVMFPVWLFQGLEKMQYITIITIFARTITLILIFVLVRKPSDYLIAAGMQSAGPFVAGIISLLTMKYIFPVKIKAPSLKIIKKTMTEGFYVFVSQIYTTLFSTSNIFILGLFASTYQVGYFAIADRIVRAVVALIGPISGTIYPRINAMFVASRQEALHALQKILYFGSSVFIIASLLLFFGAGVITNLVTGGENETITILIKIISALPFTIFVVNIFGTQIMLNTGMESYFMKVMLITGLFATSSSLFMVPLFGEHGSAIVSLLSEILEMTLMIVLVQRSGIDVLRIYHR